MCVKSIYTIIMAASQSKRKNARSGRAVRFDDLNLCKDAIEYKNNHEYKDAVEITLHFINIKELKFVYRQNRN
jgi:hypothetical protein